MPNRKQRRDMMRSQTEKNKALIAGYTKQQRIAGLIQNGITVDDLKREYEQGREDGFKAAAEPIIKCCYAGIILALHDEFGFGEQRAYRAIKAVDEKIIYALNHSEMADEVLQKTGLRLCMDEPFNRVQKNE